MSFAKGDMILNRRYKKTVAVLAIILAVTGCFSGCESKKKEEKTVKKTVEFWYYWDSTHNRRELRKLIKAFNEDQDKIEVEAKYIPDEDLKKRLALSIMDNNTPDLVLVDSPDFQYYLSMKESFVELTDKINGLEEYIPVSTAPCTVDGKVYGLPFGVNCLAMYYNKAYFEEAGLTVPTTWEEFAADAAVLSKDGHYGVAIPGIESEASVYSFLPILWSMGGDIDNLQSPESIKAFDLIERLCRDGAMSEQCISLNMGDISIQFAEGNIAMMFHPNVSLDGLKEMNPDLDIGIAPLPTGAEPVSVVGGEIFGVLKGENEEQAVEFLQYLSDKDRMEGYIDNFGFLAAREDILANQYEEDEQKEVFKEIFKTARMRDYSPGWPKISLELSKAISKVMIGDQPKEQIIANAAEAIQAVREGRL